MESALLSFIHKIKTQATDVLSLILQNICEFNLPILQRTVPCAQNAKNRQLS